MLLHREYVDETGTPVGASTYEHVAPPSIVAAPTPWSPAQLVSLVLGVGFAVFGIVALTRTGFRTAHIYTPVATVWHMPHTPLLGVLEIAYGALLIISAVVPGGMRALMGLLGAIALVVGITALFRPIPHNLVHWLGVSHRSGVVYTVVGAVIVIAAFAAPVFVPDTRRRRVGTYVCRCTDTLTSRGAVAGLSTDTCRSTVPRSARVRALRRRARPSERA